MRINTNVPAIQSYNALQATNSALAKSINKLSTGLRINTAADDAAGLAISEKMRAQYNGLDRATSNAQDGISMIQTAEGALNETHSILQRMRELAVQSANDTLTQEDRSYIQLEVDQLKEEITRISNTTQFNKKQLLDGSAAALWSSDKLTTKAMINGGLRSIDQFGQKNSVEGNYKITIKTTPGQGQVQKSDIFKIKHENVVMGKVMNRDKGFENVRVDNMPAGQYQISEAAAGAAIAPTATMAYFQKLESDFNTATKDSTAAAKVEEVITLNNDATKFGIDKGHTQQMLFDVAEINTAAGTVRFNVTVKDLAEDGTSKTFSSTEVLVNTDGLLTFDDGTTSAHKDLGWTGTTAQDAIKLADADALGKLTVGDKFVVNAAVENGGDAQITINATINDQWGEGWNHYDNTDKKVPAEITYSYNISAGVGAVSKEVRFENFFVNEENGTVHESTVTIEFNKNFARATVNDAASFEAAYVGQVAKGDVALRDLDKFWDANGKFMLQDPKTITLTQGDGKQSSVTLYSTDTIEDVRTKLNGAIANGLGQGKYVDNNTNSFVSFVEEEKDNTSESVKGTFVIRSIVPGASGEINFSGDEDIIKAFSLNQIQGSKESRYEVTIVDAHSGNMVASGAQITGNKLVGVLHENVDVTFDAMANVNVKWNETSKKFDITRSSDEYSTILHLSDNTTVFQIGANEGEDMGINIGNMSAEALGVDKLIVTDRESAAHSITTIDNAINKVSKQRAMLGAYQNRLEHTINNLTTASTNLKSSESRIRDADMAKEMMTFTKLNILSQAGNSMLAQANQLPQSVLSLLR